MGFKNLVNPVKPNASSSVTPSTLSITNTTLTSVMELDSGNGTEKFKDALPDSSVTELFQNATEKMAEVVTETLSVATESTLNFTSKGQDVLKMVLKNGTSLSKNLTSVGFKNATKLIEVAAPNTTSAPRSYDIGLEPEWQRQANEFLLKVRICENYHWCRK